MLLRVVLGFLAIILCIGIAGWVGLHIRPHAAPAVGKTQPALETVPIPASLPAPVERFVRVTYGDRIPIIKTAIITGRGTLRPVTGGPKLPIRFRFTHEAGQNYRHYIEATVFDLPILKVNEYYVNGKERMVMPWGVSENNPKLDQGGMLGMWAESILWLPAILVTDPALRWEPVDETTAWLIVPFGDSTERILFRFDPATGKVQYWETMRYKNGQGDKILWLNGTWMDEGTPWAQFDCEEVLYNVDVDVAVTVRGW
jgi:hypothetical protein